MKKPYSNLLIKITFVTSKIPNNSVLRFAQLHSKKQDNDKALRQKDLSYYQNLYQMFGDNCAFLIAELNPKQAIKEQGIYLNTLDEQTKNGKQQSEKVKKLIEQLTPLANNHDQPIILAALILLLNNSEMTYLYGSSYTNYQKFSAPFLLQYHAMLLTLKKKTNSYL